MFGNRTLKKLLLLFLAGLMLVLSACTPAAPTQVAAPTEPPVQVATLAPSPTVEPPTATTAPTATATATEEPTATPVPPTATPIPVDEQVRTWCIPKDKAMVIKAADDPATMPDGVNQGKLENGVISMLTPDLSCTFVFNLGQSIPAGSKLQVLDNFKHPWLTAEVNPSQKNPALSYTVLTHTYIVAPPYWEILYNVQLVSPDGTQLWAGQINMHTWTPAKCWDGSLPNFYTLACKKQQDIHPWDPAYTPRPK